MIQTEKETKKFTEMGKEAILKEAEEADAGTLAFISTRSRTAYFELSLVLLHTDLLIFNLDLIKNPHKPPLLI